MACWLMYRTATKFATTDGVGLLIDWVPHLPLLELRSLEQVLKPVGFGGFGILASIRKLG